MNCEGALNSPADHWSVPLSAPLVQDGADRVVFHHCGVIDRPAVEDLLAVAEAHSIASLDSVGLRKRLFNVIVEGLENTHIHAGNEHRESAFALLVDRPEGYRLIMGNAIPAATAALLATRVAILNEMDEDDLKRHFLMLLANDARTDRGGAGLGLITMARKSARPMVVHTLAKDESTAYFALEILVPRTR